MSWKRIFLLFFGFFFLLLGTTYVVLQETDAAQTFVRSTLSRFIAADWILRNAAVNLADGTVTLEDFEVANPAQEDSEHLVKVDRVELEVETNPLGDVLAVQAVRIMGLDIRLDLAADRQPTLSELLLLPSDRESTDAPYPPIVISNSTMTLGVARDRPPLRFEDIQLQLRPQEPDSSKMVITGQMHCNEFDLQLEFSGEGDVQTGELRGYAKAGDMALGAHVVERLREYFPQMPADAAYSGHVDQLVLWFEYTAETEGELEPASGGMGGGFRAELSEVSCSTPSLPYEITGATVNLAVSTRDAGTVKFAVQRTAADGNLDVTGTVTGLREDPAIDLRGEAEGLLVGGGLLTALRGHEVTRRVWDMFRPTAGRLDISAHVRRDRSDDRLRTDLDLVLDGVALSFQGIGTPDAGGVRAFPLPLVNASGKVALRDGVLSVQGVQAELAAEAGGGRVDIEGFVDLPTPDAPAQPWIDIRAPELRFTPTLRSAVGTLVNDDGEIYDDYSPKGAAAVFVRIRPEADVPGGWQVRILPLGARAKYRLFPYEVGDLHGSIDLSSEGVVIDLSGHRDAVAVEIDGRFLRKSSDSGDTERDNWSSELWVKANGVAMDPELRTAAASFSGELETLWQRFSPTGLLDVELNLWRDAEQTDFSYDIRLDVTKGSALARVFPLPVEEIHGAVFVHGTGSSQRIDFSTLRGKVRSGHGTPASLALVGTIWMGDGRTEDLTAIVRGLDLNLELADALDTLGTLKRRAWDVLKPSGTVDLVFRRAKQLEAALPDHRLTVQLRDARSDASMLPQPATAVNGEVEVTNGKVTFREVRCRMGAAEILCDGGEVSQPDDDDSVTEVTFSVRSDRFPVNDDLTRLFQGPLRQAILDRQLNGSAKVNALKLEFIIPHGEDPGGRGIQTRVSGQLEVSGVEMLLGTRIDSIGGLVYLTDSVFNNREGWIRGSFQRGSFRVFDHRCVDFVAGFYADSKRITFRGTDTALEGKTPFRFRLHQGKVSERNPDGVAMEYEIGTNGEPGTLSLDLQYESVNLNEMLLASGAVKLPYHGFMSGWVNLARLKGADFVDMEANGRLEIRDANLGTVPLFTAMYASLHEDNRPKFDGASVDFEIVDRMAWLRNLVLHSPLITVNGDGAVSMDGYLDVTLGVERFFSGSADIFIVPPLIHAITAKIVRFHLYGYPRQVRMEQRWFTEGHPRRPSVGPIPATDARPQRVRY